MLSLKYYANFKCLLIFYFVSTANRAAGYFVFFIDFLKTSLLNKLEAM